MSFNTNTIWIRINDYPNYMVSPEGAIMSTFYQGKNRCRTIKPFVTHNGYHRVLLYNEKGSRKLFVQRIVADIYCNKNDENLQVNHINGIKTDNNFKNLEWVTNSENIKHSYGVLKNKASRGENSGTNKLKELDVLDIRKRVHEG
ncbi:MAG: hypothetical protein RLZ75_3051, partial [Pseudomonadota bacterium]